MVDVLNLDKAIQAMFHIVERYVDGIVDFLLPIALLGL